MNMNNLNVEQCKNLDELCEMLNDYSEKYPSDTDSPELLLENNVDLCDLPTFGGKDPKCTMEIFSWDESRAMIPNTCAGTAYEIVDRTEDFGA